MGFTLRLERHFRLKGLQALCGLQVAGFALQDHFPFVGAKNLSPLQMEMSSIYRSQRATREAHNLELDEVLATCNIFNPFSTTCSLHKPNQRNKPNNKKIMYNQLQNTKFYVYPLKQQKYHQRSNTV